MPPHLIFFALHIQMTRYLIIVSPNGVFDQGNQSVSVCFDLPPDQAGGLMSLMPGLTAPIAGDSLGADFIFRPGRVRLTGKTKNGFEATCL